MRPAQPDLTRLWVLVGASLLLHALALWFGFDWGSETPAAPRARPTFELTWVDVEQPAVELPPSPTSAPAPPLKKLQSRTVAPSQAQGPIPAGAEEVATPTANPSDSPLAVRPSLTPSAGLIFQLPQTKNAGTGAQGSTVRNGPGEAPDPRTLNEYTQETLTRRLNADLRQDVSAAAVAVGNVPGHFKQYEAAMRRALPQARLGRTQPTGQDTARELAGVFFNTGPTQGGTQKVADSPLGRSIMNNQVMLPNTEDQRFREAGLQMMAHGESVKERLSQPRLRTVLEMTIDPSGALADVSIVERSGDAQFDESVLHFSRKVARTLPDNDDKRLGQSLWRSRWQFTWEPPDVRVRLLTAWPLDDGPAAP